MGEPGRRSDDGLDAPWLGELAAKPPGIDDTKDRHDIGVQIVAVDDDVLPEGVFSDRRVVIGGHPADLGKRLDPVKRMFEEIIVGVGLGTWPCFSCVLVDIPDVVLGFRQDDQFST